jgi:hypothetical protein
MNMPKININKRHVVHAMPSVACEESMTSNGSRVYMHTRVDDNGVEHYEIGSSFFCVGWTTDKEKAQQFWENIGNVTFAEAQKIAKTGKK